MAPEGEMRSTSRTQMPVLLIVIGGLGDWCIRRVLKHAKEYEEKSNNEDKAINKVTVVVVDVHPLEDPAQGTFDQWVEHIDRWIVRRLIEQSAEDVDLPLRDETGLPLKGIEWGFTERLATNPVLPDPSTPDGLNSADAIETFLNGFGDVFQAARAGKEDQLRQKVESLMSNYPTARPQSKATLIDALVGQILKLADNTKKRLYDERQTLKKWLQKPVPIAGREVYRYWRSDPTNNILYQYLSDDSRIVVSDDMLRQFANQYRIIVYVATPPEIYPDILDQWSAYAERIALEKPIAGLLEKV